MSSSMGVVVPATRWHQLRGLERMCNIQESTIHDSLQMETSALMNDHSCINPFTNTYYGQTPPVGTNNSNSHQPEQIDNSDAIAMTVPSLVCNSVRSSAEFRNEAEFLTGSYGVRNSGIYADFSSTAGARNNPCPTNDICVDPAGAQRTSST